MTTIAVVQKNGIACIAADTLTKFGATRMNCGPGGYTRGQSKILQVDDTFLGIAGSAAHKSVLESYFANPEAPRAFASRREIFETWRTLHHALKQDYYLNPNDEESDPYENTQVNALLANAHGIFGIYTLRDVDCYSRFWALGTGRAYALGALFSNYDRLDSAEDIAKSAIAAAAEFDDGTSLPLETYTIRLNPAFAIPKAT